MIPANSLRRQIIFVLFFMLGNWAFAFASDAKSPYVLLLDVSGSMDESVPNATGAAEPKLAIAG